MWIQKALRKDVNVMMNAKYRKQRLIDKDDFVPMITDVCKALGKYSREAVQLLLGTEAAEGSLVHRVQIGGGPARGLWQMEPETVVSLFENYLRYRPTLYWKTLAMWLDITGDMARQWRSITAPTSRFLAYHLEHDDVFACAMARIKYLPAPAAIPKTVEGQAAYWLRVYNAGGKGTVEHYICQWEACRCEQLLGVYGL